MTIFGFLGCCGAARESQCLLGLVNGNKDGLLFQLKFCKCNSLMIIIVLYFSFPGS